MKRLIAFLLVFLLGVTALPLGGVAEETSNTWVEVNDSTVTTHGRTFYNDGYLWFNWTYSGFSFSFYGTSAKGIFRSGEHNNAYLNVYVDGSLVASNTIILKGTKKTFTLIEGLPEGEHTITVRKRTENRGNATAGISHLQVDGYLLEQLPQKSQNTIEVIGDSITCGFGNLMDGTYSMGYQAKGQEGTLTFATLATSRFDAETTVIARSGIGFQYNNGGDTADSMMDVYTQTDYFHNNGQDWDFAANPSDLVIIALGTNDTSAPSADAFYQGATKFLAKVRKNNPDAIIIWAYEVITASYSNQIKQVVVDANFEGDDKVFYHSLGLMDKEADGVGLDGHPTVKTHKKEANGLALLIEELTGWKMGPENPSVTLTFQEDFKVRPWKNEMVIVPPSYAGMPLEDLKKGIVSSPLTFGYYDGRRVGETLTSGLVVLLRQQDFVLDYCMIIVLGDVTQDGNINAQDALEVLKYTVGKVQLDGISQASAAVSGGNQITAKDALQILRYTVGKITEF